MDYSMLLQSGSKGSPAETTKPPAVAGAGKPTQQRSVRPIRVLIADDHEIVRKGIRTLLAAKPQCFEICGEAASGLEAIKKAREMKPDVVVIDVSMPGSNGLETSRTILKEVPSAQVLILTMHDSEQLIREVLRVGARGYLLKTDVAHDLPIAIESLYTRRPFFSSKIAQKVVEGYLKDSARGGCEPRLTPAERRVIQLLAEGKSNKEVGNLLGISGETCGNPSRQHHAKT